MSPMSSAFASGPAVVQDARGDVVVYERWGAIDPAQIMKTMPIEAYAQWNARVPMFDQS